MVQDDHFLQAYNAKITSTNYERKFYKHAYNKGTTGKAKRLQFSQNLEDNSTAPTSHPATTFRSSRPTTARPLTGTSSMPKFKYQGPEKMRLSSARLKSARPKYKNIHAEIDKDIRKTEEKSMRVLSARADNVKIINRINNSQKNVLFMAEKMRKKKKLQNFVFKRNKNSIMDATRNVLRSKKVNSYERALGIIDKLPETALMMAKETLENLKLITEKL